MNTEEFKSYLADMIGDAQCVYDTTLKYEDKNVAYFNCYYFITGVKRSMAYMKEMSVRQYKDALNYLDKFLKNMEDKK